MVKPSTLGFNVVHLRSERITLKRLPLALRAKTACLGALPP